MPSRVSALARSTHPGPAVAVTVVTLLLAVGAGLEVWRTVLVTLAVGLNQLSVGLSNDWLDADRDRAVGRTDKPVASGAVGVGAVRAAAFATLALALLFTSPLGLPATLAHALFLAAAWAYNLGVKSTAFSMLPYLIAFGTLPAIVTLSASEPALPAWWACAAGALLGAAAHVANVLPDRDDDARTGVRGFVHRLPLGAAGLLLWLALLGAAALVAFGDPPPRVPAVVGFGIVLALAVAGIARLARGDTGRVLFRLVMVAAVVIVISLAFGGASLLS
ncbi:4-hydroxybenzoate polyprenyltransferase [Diaminobutyricimonas aerilata]|uniref:4-hydroxybenzoate polyprenyltransferase n=1 Tax=Diaminobutyricimonas aerilata TaxID=1162967 RepID=A0A2M9CJG2_9MICO|nr:UbiA family prenyltransferase [Diaminobutyricimonas aerilata]PJJ71988.1 4-hydroxybenzoate polyprenyltransferase [Diaminobutyricimonas aerilata]